MVQAMGSQLLEYHIFRITHPQKPNVIISKNVSPIPELDSEIMASFKTADLRDIAFAAFAHEVNSKREVYPHHTIARKKGG